MKYYFARMINTFGNTANISGVTFTVIFDTAALIMDPSGAFCWVNIT